MIFLKASFELRKNIDFFFLIITWSETSTIIPIIIGRKGRDFFY